MNVATCGLSVGIDAPGGVVDGVGGKVNDASSTDKMGGQFLHVLGCRGLDYGVWGQWGMYLHGVQVQCTCTPGYPTCVCIRGWRACVHGRCPSVVMVDDHTHLTGRDTMEMGTKWNMMMRMKNHAHCVCTILHIHKGGGDVFV